VFSGLNGFWPQWFPAYIAQMSTFRTAGDGRYGPSARALIGGEDQAEYVNALLLGVQRTPASA
jgi:hypothetical protein